MDVSKYRQERLNRFRTEEKYCDVRILVGEKLFPCHRVVLASAAEFFDGMFGGNFIESKNTEVSLGNIEADTFEEILNFIYTDCVTVTTENAYRLLAASEYFGLPFLEEKCIAYIKDNVPINSVIDILIFACNTKKTTLVNIISKHIAKNFSQVSKMKKSRYIPFQILRQILTYNNIEINSDSLTEFLLKWVKKDPDNRKKYVPDLLRKIDVQISVSCLLKLSATNMCVEERKAEDEGENCHEVMDIDDEIEMDSVNDGILRVYVTEKYKPGSVEIYAVRKKCEKVKLIEELDPFPYDNDSVVTSYKSVFLEGHLYTLASNKRRYKFFRNEVTSELQPRSSLATPPGHTRNAQFRIVATKTTIYAYNANLEFENRKFYRRLFQYNTFVNGWYPLPELFYKDSRYSCLVSSNHLLYVFGGALNSNKCVPGFAQFYDERCSKWYALPKMFYEHHNGAACVYKGKFYVSGGENSSYYDKSFEVFDPVAGKWTLLTPMLQMKKEHVLVPYRNELWAIGGSGSNLSTCVYNPKKNIWYDVSCFDELKSRITGKHFQVFDAFDYENVTSSLN